MFQPIKSSEVAQHKSTGFITIYQPIAGHKAIQFWWCPELGGYWEPWETGICAHKTAKEAYQDAKMWAEADDLPYVILPELEI